jgi:hypothetical protein
MGKTKVEYTGTSQTKQEFGAIHTVNEILKYFYSIFN